MFDCYSYQIEANGTLVVGYRQNNQCLPAMPSYLYTTLRMIRVRTGEADWKIGDRVWHLQKDDIVAVNNMEQRQFVHTSEDFSYDTYGFPPTVFAQNSECLSFFYNRSADFVPVFRTGDGCFERVVDFLETLTELLLRGDQTKEAVILASSLLSGITALMMMSRRESLTGKYYYTATAAAVADTIQYINRHLTEDLSVRRLAKMAAMSSGYFSEKFKMYTGVGIPKFVNQARAANAARLLQTDKELTVLDAAVASGFSSSSGFYQAFHSVFGMSPKAYLNRLNAG